MIELVFGNALVVTRAEAFRGVVRIAKDRIVEIERSARVPAGAVDCEGDWLIPDSSSCTRTFSSVTPSRGPVCAGRRRRR